MPLHSNCTLKTPHLKSWIVYLLFFSYISVSADAKPPLSIGVTVSGGVSYGSYQAGYHYVANDWLRMNRNVCRVRVVTGASAGAINALLTVLSIADTGFVSDTGSLFYKSWIPISYQRLNCGKSPIGLLGRDYFYVLRDSIIRPAVNIPPPGDTVDIVLGVTGTRVEPTHIRLTDRLELPTVEQKFTIRMTRNSTGKWVFRNYIDKGSKLPAVVLPFRVETGDTTDCNIVTNIIFASSGFPCAFPPLSIDLWEIIPYETKNVSWDTAAASLWMELSNAPEGSVAGKPESPLFNDGGVFDNTPMKYAADLSCNGLVNDSSGIGWAATPRWRAANPNLDTMLFIYLSQNNTVFPRSKCPPKEIDSSMIKSIFNMGSNIIGSARSKELRSVTEKYPSFNPHLTNCYAPTMSGYLGNFLGFFEKQFRVFDFYLGMYDACKYFEDIADRGLENLGYTVAASLPSVEEERADIRFMLTRKVLDIIYATVDSCSKNGGFAPDSSYWQHNIDEVNRFFREISDTLPQEKKNAFVQHAIMLQSSIDRLWGRWYCFTEDNTYWEADTSQAAAWSEMKKYRPTFFGLPPVRERLFYDRVAVPIAEETKGKLFGKSEFDALLYLLKQYGYTYSDIVPGKNAGGDEVKLSISKKLTSLIKRLSRNQDNYFEKEIYKYEAKPLMNLLAYSPPVFTKRIGLGTDGINAGLSWIMYNRLRSEVYGTLGKGSKANLGNSKRSQWYPPFLLHAGFLLDIWKWNAVFQLKYGLSAGYGKDWMLNPTSRTEWFTDWTFKITPFTIQATLFDQVYLRFLYGGQCAVNLDRHTLTKWDWTRIDGQFGLQLAK
ncbi:MAG: patatin-like phospholipase family protein [Chitinispirillaceae bacterium]|nr:patatin-like phospholipase family protein [Chitinispirillaceae bacterium]